MDILISVIIPVYNVQDYLRKCIESVLNQNYINYEIILINDGSTDKSLEICEEYQSKFREKIFLINKTNEGLSAARNDGIKKSNGDYLIFLDSDDFWSYNFLNDFVKEILKQNEPDLVITRITDYYDNHTYEIDSYHTIKNINLNNKRHVLNHFSSGKNVSYAAVRYVVKASFIKKHQLLFKEGIFHEDEEWTTKIFLYSNSYGYYEKSFYNYRKKRENSITNNITLKHTLDMLIISGELIYEMKNTNIKYEKYYLKRRCEQILYGSIIKSFIYLSNEERLIYEQKLKLNLNIFLEVFTIKSIILFLLIKCGNYRLIQNYIISKKLVK